MGDEALKILDYLKLGLAGAVVIAIAYFRGKYYGNKPPVEMPDNTDKLNKAKQHEAAAKKAQEEAAAAEAAAKKKIDEANKLKAEADKAHEEAEKLRQEAQALEEKNQALKDNLAALENKIEHNHGAPVPHTIEELDDELKK